MNLAGLKSAFERNKKGLAVAGAVAVGGLGLMQARRGGSAPAAAATTAAATPSGAAVSGYAPYDSTGYDVYNALQPQLQALADRWDKEQATKPPVPVPAPPSAGYYRVTGTSRTYYQDAEGNLDWISKAEGQAITKAAGKKQPKINLVSKDSTFWKGRTYLDPKGSGAPKTPDKVWPYPVGGSSK